MAVTTLLLELYFAAILGVSGLAKIENPAYFASTLRRHGILPQWSITGVSRVFPWLELMIAFSLISGAANILAAVLAIALFVSFAATEMILVVTKRATECGCYGVAYPQKVDWASVVVSSLLIIAAGVHFWIVLHTPPVRWEWRFSALLLFAAFIGWLTLRMCARRRAWSQTIEVALAGAQRGG